MKKMMTTMALVLGFVVSASASAGTLSCDIYGKNTAKFTFNPNGDVQIEFIENLTKRTLLKAMASSVEQEGDETVIHFNPWNYEFRIANLDGQAPYYKGTLNTHQPKAYNPILEMVCVLK